MDGGDQRKGARRAEDRARDRFLASLSHELRTPLGGVLGMADLLASTPLNPDQQTYVQAIRDCGQHLMGLVNDVLDLAKIEADKLELHPAPLDLEKLLQDVCELLSPRAHAKGVEVAWWAPAGMPTPLADEARLRQILFNLAGNAVKFTDAGGVTLSAELLHREGPRALIRFTVADTGPGVAFEDQARIFEPFAQTQAGDARPFDSTGLGLAIVNRLVQAHGGRIGIESAPGKGALFWFDAEFELAAEAAPARPLAGALVAVVSANPVVRHAARGQVEASGGTAQLFDSLEAAEAAPLEAVALIDAPLTLRQPPRPLVARGSIVLLAPEQRELIGACRRAGFAGYLIKPLRRGSLAARVLAVSGTAAPAAPRAVAVDERAEPPAHHGARVLVAEDNPINALLIRSMLRREGCEVHRVESGEEAVSAARDGRFDCILMDLRLPCIDGIAATRRLRAMGVRTPIAALTADAFEEDRRACLDAGMDEFMTKPLDPAALEAWLGRVAAGAFTRTPAEAKLAS